MECQWNVPNDKDFYKKINNIKKMSKMRFLSVAIFKRKP